MSYINENCVYASVCIDHACSCALWGREFEQDTYNSLKAEFDAEIAEFERDQKEDLRREAEEAEWKALMDDVHYNDEDGWTI